MRFFALFAVASAKDERHITIAVAMNNLFSRGTIVWRSDLAEHRTLTETLLLTSTLPPVTLRKSQRLTRTTSNMTSVCGFYRVRHGSNVEHILPDLQVHTEMLKFARQLTETSPLKEIICRWTVLVLFKFPSQPASV